MNSNSSPFLFIFLDTFFVNSAVKSHIIFGQCELLLLFYLFFLIPICHFPYASKSDCSLFNIVMCVYVCAPTKCTSGMSCKYCVCLIYASNLF